MGLISKLREQYRRFRAWQQNPFDYTNHSTHTERCANCGTEFSANFCPICGQKAGIGRVSWRTVRQGLMMIWGMDSRSLAYSLVQLLLRPGYLISDYISGKRQVSFPPVKMLLIVAIGAMIADYFFEVPSPEKTEAKNNVLNTYIDWVDANPGWGMLTLTCFMLFPTWLFFRYAPKHRKHTLPEGFFIQVFMSSLLVMILILTTITHNVMFVWVLPIFYLIAYHQLFGYSWWGTLWRTIFCCIQSLVLIVSIEFVGNFIMRAPQTNELQGTLSAVVLSLFMVSVWFITEMIKRKRGKN